MRNKRTALYRHFSDDNLLYVGISLSAVQRLSQHKNHAKWFENITNVVIEYFDSRELAEKAEIDAIKSEKPLFNIRHNQEKKEIKAKEKPKRKIEQKQNKITTLKALNKKSNKIKINHLPAKMQDFDDFSLNGKRLVIACYILSNDVKGTYSLDGEFAVTARYFSELFNIPISDSFNELSIALKDLSETLELKDNEKSNDEIEYRLTKHSWVSGSKILNDCIIIGFRGDTIELITSMKSNNYYSSIVNSIKSIDITGCGFEYWDEYLNRIYSERDRWAEEYLKKHNCEGQSFDAIYHCKGDDTNCNMGNFFAPSSMKDNPPPCELCGGETAFECLYDD